MESIKIFESKIKKQLVYHIPLIIGIMMGAVISMLYVEQDIGVTMIALRMLSVFVIVQALLVMSAKSRTIHGSVERELREEEKEEEKIAVKYYYGNLLFLVGTIFLMLGVAVWKLGVLIVFVRYVFMPLLLMTLLLDAFRYGEVLKTKGTGKLKGYIIVTIIIKVILTLLLLTEYGESMLSSIMYYFSYIVVCLVFIKMIIDIVLRYKR